MIAPNLDDDHKWRVKKGDNPSGSRVEIFEDEQMESLETIKSQNLMRPQTKNLQQRVQSVSKIVTESFVNVFSTHKRVSYT